MILPFKVLLGGGAWASKTKKKMRDKYYVLREQYNKMEAPNMKGTTLQTAIKDLNLGGPSKTLLRLHQVGRRFPITCFFYSRGRMEFGSILSM